MDLRTIQNTYKRYSNVYDYLFGKILEPGRQRAVQLVNELSLPFQRVLEVGVGTGLSLLHYRPDLEIVGIDVSKEMLKKAQLRMQGCNDQRNCTLLEMDAENLTFQDNSFDFIVAMYVVSVLPNITAFMNEVRRVCTAQGDIIILNHFSSKHFLINKAESLFNPLHGYLGFHPNFSIDSIINFPDFELVQIYKTNVLGYWKLIHLKNIKNT